MTVRMLMVRLSLAGWAFTSVLMGWTYAATAQTVVLQTSGSRTAESTTQREPIAALQESVAELSMQLTSADARQAGDVWLEISADASAAAPAHITLRIPLSSTADVYGEARSCKTKPDGTLDLIFTAGLEEKNYVRFAAANGPTTMRFLLNKYLCRALAAPFRCDGRPVTVSSDWSQWQLGGSSRIVLTSGAPASLTLSPARVTSTGKAFDPASCNAIAPSSGLCCVGGRTTEWHCGGTPAGEGWHQVSGECFHRETGTSCKDGEPLTLR